MRVVVEAHIDDMVQVGVSTASEKRLARMGAYVQNIHVVVATDSQTLILAGPLWLHAQSVADEIRVYLRLVLTTPSHKLARRFVSVGGVHMTYWPRWCVAIESARVHQHLLTKTGQSM